MVLSEGTLVGSEDTTLSVGGCVGFWSDMQHVERHVAETLSRGP